MTRRISRRELGDALQLGVALLAAGASRRFGDADKLAQPLGNCLLGEHAAAAIPVDRFARAWVITSVPDHPCEPGWVDAGFDPILNPVAATGMGSSAALAAGLAARERLDGLLIALADMPLVPESHFAALVDAVQFQDDMIASAKGRVRMPPALFSSAHFVVLTRLSGDTGARELLAQARTIECSPEWLIDVDTPETLATLRAKWPN